jgi:hypothetical protein
MSGMTPCVYGVRKGVTRDVDPRRANNESMVETGFEKGSQDVDLQRADNERMVETGFEKGSQDVDPQRADNESIVETGFEKGSQDVDPRRADTESMVETHHPTPQGVYGDLSLLLLGPQASVPTSHRQLHIHFLDLSRIVVDGPRHLVLLYIPPKKAPVIRCTIQRG